jgi:hypothetical protein
MGSSQRSTESGDDDGDEVEGDPMVDDAHLVGWGAEDVFKKKVIKPVSKYRRENLRYLRGQPKKVYIQILYGLGRDAENSSVFEVNLDSLTC